jgi:hypothetical protein
LISCDLQFHVLEKHVVHIFIYNPYSIVNERMIAKTGAEHSRNAVPTADIRGLDVSLRDLGGADRARTDDPLLAKQVLSQAELQPRFGLKIENPDRRITVRRSRPSIKSWWA